MLRMRHSCPATLISSKKTKQKHGKRNMTYPQIKHRVWSWKNLNINALQVCKLLSIISVALPFKIFWCVRHWPMPMILNGRISSLPMVTMFVDRAITTILSLPHPQPFLVKQNLQSLPRSKTKYLHASLQKFTKRRTLMDQVMRAIIYDRRKSY